MAGSKGPDAAAPAVISRRDAIIGALALAGGTLVSARPDAALASNGQALTAGGMVYTSGETIIHLSPTPAIPDPSSSIISSAILNRNGAFGDAIQALYGSVDPGAAAGSIGVQGIAWGPGLIGIQAQHYQANGTALKVIGRTQFSRSGTGTVAKNTASRTVPVASGVNSGSKILVTLQGNGGTGVYLKYAAMTSATRFKVYLTKACTKAVKFSWMVTD